MAGRVRLRPDGIYEIRHHAWHDVVVLTERVAMGGLIAASALVSGLVAMALLAHPLEIGAGAALGCPALFAVDALRRVALPPPALPASNSQMASPRRVG
jgi:hypothetical protein